LVSVTDNGQPTEATVTGLPLIELARASLDARGKRIGTRQVARVAGKLAIQNAIEKSVAKSNGSDAGEIIGGLTSLLLFALEQADTRSWETLPGNLSLLRVPLSEGQHSIRVDVSSGLQEHSILIDNISVRRGRPSFRMIRDGVLLVPAVQPSAPALTPVSADAELTQAYLDVNQPLD